MIEKKSPAANSKKLTKHAHRRRQIKEVKTKLNNLSPTAAAEVVNEVVAEQAKKQFSGFTEFIREQGVVGVGIGLVLGIQIKAVVDTIMLHFVDPLTKLLPGGVGLSESTVSIKVFGQVATLGWGAVAYSLITFILVALIIYAAYKAFHLDKLKKKA